MFRKIEKIKYKKGYVYVSLIITNLSPVKYYVEERILVGHIRKYLEDADMDTFIANYKKSQFNYYESLGNTMPIFYSYGPKEWCLNTKLVFNEQFFKMYKQDRYYCKKSSFENAKSMLVKEYYSHKKGYLEAIKCLDCLTSKYVLEGSILISFIFHDLRKRPRITNYDYNADCIESCGIKINNRQ